MTAIISVLNKKAVAVAADSAVTIDDKKIYMHGEKLFALSPNAPVAVAIYGNLNLISVPWDILVKEYAKHLNQQPPLSSLKDYAMQFFEFLHQRHFYLSPQIQKARLRGDMLIYVKSIITDSIADYANMSPADLERRYEQQISEILNGKYANISIMESLNNLNLADFIADNDALIDNVISSIHADFHIQANKASLSDLLYRVFCSEIAITNHTGLVFVGYGEDEIYPSLYNYEIRDIVNGRVAAKEIKGNRVVIDNPDTPTISSFAQNDMFHAVVKGISPEVKSCYADAFKETYQNLVSKINSLIPNGSPKLDDAIQTTLNRYFKQVAQDYQTKADNKAYDSYIKPIVESIGALDKLDLADFAENIIKVTEIRRNIITEQLNTVGGPIDVLVITKGDGLVWMKRKQYIDHNINP